jgi:ketosteroid isomerase-like protein
MTFIRPITQRKAATKGYISSLMHRLSIASLSGALVISAVSPGAANAQIGRGGDQPAPNAVANAYRSEVRNRLNSLVIQLAGAWDGSDPKQAAAFYVDNAVIVLGPERTIVGRDAIRSAFGSTLRHMRGVVLTIDDYDLSGELAVVRGTMMYELLHERLPGSQETATYTMVLRRQRSDDWLITEHMVAGALALPEAGKASVTAAPAEVQIKQ